MKSFFCLTLILLLFIGFNLAGCVPMNLQSPDIEQTPALNKYMKKIDLSKESVALLTVKISNKYKTDYPPNIQKIFIWEENKENRKIYSFGVEEKYKKVENEYNEYLISFQLPPGNYKVSDLKAVAGIFPVVGSFSVPIYLSFIIPSNKIVYLGNLEANIIERTSDDQLRAGPIIPLIDQKVTGASGGTFLIEISNKFEEDVLKFVEKYPYLKGFDIENNTLPSWKPPTENDMQ